MVFFIKEMTEKELDQVCRLEEKCFLTPWTRQALEGELKNPLASYLVLLDQEDQGQLLAYGGYSYVLNEGNINNIAVDPDHRGQSLGRILTEALIQSAKEKGVEQLFLEVRTSNHIAQSLYRSLGFKMVNVRKGYYADTDEDAIVMALEIE